MSYYLFNTLKKKNNVNVINDLCKDLKSIKNKTEIRNTRLAHLRDGLALVKVFLLARKNLYKNISEFEASKKTRILQDGKPRFFFIKFSNNISHWF